MNWALAIERNHRALLRLVAVLFAAVGLVPGGASVSSMSQSVRARVIRVLRPAEAALRRLIFIAAQEIVVVLREKRVGVARRKGKRGKAGKRAPLFRLFDPRKWFPELSRGRRPLSGPGPRISGFDDGSWVPFEDAGPKTEPVNPEGLCRRLQALHSALEDIAAQAARLARVQSRRRAAAEPLSRTEPLRPGWPPGHRKHPTHEIDEVLSDCHTLARMEPRPPDIARYFSSLV